MKGFKIISLKLSKKIVKSCVRFFYEKLWKRFGKIECVLKFKPAEKRDGFGFKMLILALDQMLVLVYILAPA